MSLNSMSPSLQCHPVDSHRDQRQFLDLECRIYREDSNWVPPLWMVRKELLGFKYHPFYDSAESQAFLVRRGDRVIGRVLAIVNHAHNQLHQEKRGFFGFYECENDQAASDEMLSSATKWLADRGMTDVRGPVHPSLNYECGLLVDGFDTPPTYMIPYNCDYYGRLIENFGFTKSQDLYSYDAHIDILDDIDPKLQFVIDEATRRFKVKCRPIDRRNFAKDVRSFLEIYNLSLQQTWGYVPMSEKEIDHQGKGLRHLIVPELTSIAEIDGKPVGAGFGLLDFNQLIKKINGRLLPLGWLTLLTQKRKIDRLRLISTNVLPEYQKWGLGLVTLARILPDAVAFGIRVGEFSWVLESNQLSRGTIERGGAQRTKVHRIYDKPLN
ncbi:MAG: N-acetyltransferase [Planctomycetota bacterium]|nr:N-acetyltransferase [Planctomycetota bacterium]